MIFRGNNPKTTRTARPRGSRAEFHETANEQTMSKRNRVQGEMQHATNARKKPTLGQTPSASRLDAQ